MTHQTTVRPRNAWLALITDYWADPKNVIGPPGALVRRLVKFLWLVVTVYLLFWVAGPSQVKSLQLWMEDDRLASDIAWAFTYASALCFSVVAFVAVASEPVRIPIPFPERLWPLDKWRWVHVHAPNIRVAGGTTLVVALLATQLYIMYNFYTHEQMEAGGASVAALSGSDNRVAEAEAALAAGAAAWMLSDQQAGQALSEAPASYVTARSRIMRERREAATAWQAERRRLEGVLVEARTATVATRQEFTDPRPADGQLASMFKLDRPFVAALMDLMRSVVIEGMLVLGLGMVVHPTREGVPREKRTTVEEDVLAETPAAPEEEAAPMPPPRRRFTLPPANAEDMAVASVVGPHARAEAPAAIQEPEPQETHQRATEAEGEATIISGASDEAIPEGEADYAEPMQAPPIEPETAEPLDPLMAEHLAAQQAEKENV